MAKPTIIPTWDTNETLTLEPDATRKADGWVEVSAGVGQKPQMNFLNFWQNLVYKWVLWIDTILGGNRLVIDTQVKFDAYFDGVGTKTGNIYLASGINYQLNSGQTYGTNFTLDGDPGTLITRAGAHRFVPSGTPTNVHFSKNLVFVGDKATYTMSTNGGFADITGVSNSIFEITVLDSKTSANGGAYYATPDSTSNCIIKNISGCEASSGSAVYGCTDSEISNITNCTGDAVVACNKSEIKDINNNIDVGVNNCDDSHITDIYSNGDSGVKSCDDCTISSIYDNGFRGVESCDRANITKVYANTGGVGVYDCLDSVISNVHGHVSNDGVQSCPNSTITNIYNNGTVGGGIGVSSSDNCTIDNIHNNGHIGVVNCDNSTISNIHNNDNPDTDAGGCYNCTNSVFTGTFIGNTSTGTYDQISSCATSLAFAIGDGTTSVKISAARETINF